MRAVRKPNDSHMITRRIFFVTSIAATLAANTGANAANSQAFEVASFAEAQRSGKSVLVAIYARWCPVCFVQRTILSVLLHDAKYRDLTYMIVDFDNQKPFVRYFHAQAQSTLIVFKSGAERGRSVGETNTGSISELLDRIN